MTNAYVTNIYSVPLTPNIVITDNNTINNNMYYLDELVKRTLNNYPLCIINNDCSDITVPDPVTPPVIVDNPTLNTLTSSVTFEKIYQNIASLPSHNQMVNKRYFIKIYTIDANTTIKVVNDMQTDGEIITTMSGDTGYPNILIRKITYVRNSHIDTIYYEGGANI